MIFHAVKSANTQIELDHLLLDGNLSGKTIFLNLSSKDEKQKS